MTTAEFQEFIVKSGLKKNYIARTVLDVPSWVITTWLGGKSMLYPLQQKKLDEFCSAYVKNNPHMQNVNVTE